MIARVRAPVALLEPQLPDLETIAGLGGESPRVGIVALRFRKKTPLQRKARAVMEADEDPRGIAVAPCARENRLESGRSGRPVLRCDRRFHEIAARDPGEILASRGYREQGRLLE